MTSTTAMCPSPSRRRSARDPVRARAGRLVAPPNSSVSSLRTPKNQSLACREIQLMKLSARWIRNSIDQRGVTMTALAEIGVATPAIKSVWVQTAAPRGPDSSRTGLRFCIRWRAEPLRQGGGRPAKAYRLDQKATRAAMPDGSSSLPGKKSRAASSIGGLVSTIGHCMKNKSRRHFRAAATGL
jgi:hypothetical protein